LIQDDPKLLDDSGEVPKFKEEVGGSIPSCEIVSLLDRKTCHVANSNWLFSIHVEVCFRIGEFFFNQT